MWVYRQPPRIFSTTADSSRTLKDLHENPNFILVTGVMSDRTLGAVLTL